MKFHDWPDAGEGSQKDSKADGVAAASEADGAQFGDRTEHTPKLLEALDYQFAFANGRLLTPVLLQEWKASMDALAASNVNVKLVKYDGFHWIDTDAR